jgi:hypothetical protein
MGPRASLNDMEKRQFLTLPGLKLRPLGRPASSQSLYRLSYPGSSFCGSRFINDNLVNICMRGSNCLWSKRREIVPALANLYFCLRPM